MTKQELIDFETKVKEAWERGEIKAPVHLSGGNEDQLIEIFKEIKTNDYKFLGHRNHYHLLLSGVSSDDILQEILGSNTAMCKGRARSMGLIAADKHCFSSAIVGGMCAVAVGVAWALKYQQENDVLRTDEFGTPPRHVWCFIGDGAVDGGHFWEALQYAEGWDLPITFVIEDNNRATCTPVYERCGPEFNFTRNRVVVSWKCKYYTYEPTYPHVGSGTYVQF